MSIGLLVQVEFLIRRALRALCCEPTACGSTLSTLWTRRSPYAARCLNQLNRYMSGKRSSPRSSRPSPQQAEAAAGLVEVVASSMTVIDEFEISEGELHTCPAPRCSASFNSFAKLEAHLLAEHHGCRIDTVPVVPLPKPPKTMEPQQTTQPPTAANPTATATKNSDPAATAAESKAVGAMAAAGRSRRAPGSPGRAVCGHRGCCAACSG